MTTRVSPQKNRVNTFDASLNVVLFVAEAKQRHFETDQVLETSPIVRALLSTLALLFFSLFLSIIFFSSKDTCSHTTAILLYCPQNQSSAAYLLPMLLACYLAHKLSRCLFSFSFLPLTSPFFCAFFLPFCRRDGEAILHINNFWNGVRKKWCLIIALSWCSM